MSRKITAKLSKENRQEIMEALHRDNQVLVCKYHIAYRWRTWTEDGQPLRGDWMEYVVDHWDDGVVFKSVFLEDFVDWLRTADIKGWEDEPAEGRAAMKYDRSRSIGVEAVQVAMQGAEYEF
jgi:hypothetical protein